MSLEKENIGRKLKAVNLKIDWLSGILNIFNDVSEFPRKISRDLIVDSDVLLFFLSISSIDIKSESDVNAFNFWFPNLDSLAKDINRFNLNAWNVQFFIT